MHRKCSGDDIKKIWSNQLALLCKCKLSSRIWYELRISAEKYVCRKENHYEFTYKELIKEIYNRVSGIADNKNIPNNSPHKVPILFFLNFL